MLGTDSGVDIVNGFSVDVEEYFHALALAPCAPRSRWGSMPSRVEANTGILLDLLARNNTKGTFFVVGWVAERCPQLVRRIAAEGHEVTIGASDE